MWLNFFETTKSKMIVEKRRNCCLFVFLPNIKNTGEPVKLTLCKHPACLNAHDTMADGHCSCTCISTSSRGILVGSHRFGQGTGNLGHWYWCVCKIQIRYVLAKGDLVYLYDEFLLCKSSTYHYCSIKSILPNNHLGL